MISELFLEHNGALIYHAYKDNMRLSYWYSTSPKHGYGDRITKKDFDVRQLKTYADDLSHADIIRAAIGTGEINQKGVKR